MANEAWEALFRAQATVQRELLAADVWDGLNPSDYGVLYALSKAPDGLRITALSEDALLTQAGISRLIARLETQGLVERVADPADGRASQTVWTTRSSTTRSRNASTEASRYPREPRRLLKTASRTESGAIG